MFGDFTQRNINEQLDHAMRLAYIAELREWDNRTHLERVRKYCFLLGEAIDLSYEENVIIATAAILHDVGKVILPEDLLKKTENFTPAEKKLSEHHTIEGAQLLENSSSQILLMGSTIALTHHERWDGSGFPNQLLGDKIPLSGRICALADVFDALTTHRSYKPSISSEQALNLLTDPNQHLFDPIIIKALVKKYNDFCRILNSYQK